MNKRGRFWILIFALCVLSGCATSYDSRGVFHKVRKGESLPWIAKSYGVDLQDLAEQNNIQNVNKIPSAGEKLYVPPRRTHRYKKLPFEEAIARNMEGGMARKKANKIFAKKKRGKMDSTIYTDPTRFIWPVGGSVISPFGVRHGRRHDGVDIRAAAGTPIRVADSGSVVYAGSMSGYGNLILVRHANNFFTAYAHNKKNGVKEGETVKRGQIIGQVGRTGRATGSHLHFEVREGEKARNPLFFLPASETRAEFEKKGSLYGSGKAN